MAQLKGGTYVGGDLTVATNIYTTKLQVSGTIDGLASSAIGVLINPILLSSTTNNTSNSALSITPTFNTTSSNVSNAYGVKISPIHTGTYATTNAYGLYVDATAITNGTITNNYAAVFNGGNVGIGTTNPQQKLDVNGAVSVGNNTLVLGNVGGVNRIQYSDGGFVILNSGDTPLMTIKNSANVLINTSTDNGVDKLQVNGSAYVNGDLRVDLTATLGTDHTYNGTTIVGTAGESLVFGDFVYFKFSDLKWWKANASAYATARTRGIAVVTLSANDAGKILIEGVIRDDSWNWTAAEVWLSTTAGAGTSTQPSTTGNQIQFLGTALSADHMLFKPSQDIGEK